jgi:glycogen debranching enzyme
MAAAGPVQNCRVSEAAGEVDHEDLERTVDGLLSAQGWAYASALPVEAGDPGRFHALFGRDSLIFALQLLASRPEIARGTLRALAAVRGRTTDPEIDEEPGKILHEWRPVAPQWLVDGGWPVRDGAIRYYGTSDATSWFLILLAATGDAALQAELASTVAAAGDWLDGALAAGGGLVRCGPRRHPGGLSQQGWRDSRDPGRDDDGGGGIVGADGRAPSAPMADADSQAAAFGALAALAVLDPTRAGHWTERRARLRARLSADFGPEVMALDAENVPVTGAGSQLGWLLWAGALDEAAAAAAAQRLVGPDVLTPFGVRTLSVEHPAFHVAGYHRGAVWPFDNWIAWGGLRHHGYEQEAEWVRSGVLTALRELGRYPELYAVDRGGRLLGMPVANRVQAWTLGAVSAFTAGWSGITTGAPRG